MKINCPSPDCKSRGPDSPKSRPPVRNGFYRRTSDSRRIQRYRCPACEKNFSAAGRSACFNQKKRRINAKLRELICSGVSQRRAAILLKVNRKTVVRRFRFLADQSRLQHQQWLLRYRAEPLKRIQFDDLETSEHTKCKPLSVAIAVCGDQRKILSFEISQMPANGLLARKALKKYGYPRDDARMGWHRLMQSLSAICHPEAEIKSDENPHYPYFVKALHPTATHTAVKGARGSIGGQGELKKLRYDPLFSLNHTCAMFRANLNRLFRRTWCTTKTRQGLADHLAIYTYYHNTVLTPPAAKRAS